MALQLKKSKKKKITGVQQLEKANCYLLMKMCPLLSSKKIHSYVCNLGKMGH